MAFWLRPAGGDTSSGLDFSLFFVCYSGGRVGRASFAYEASKVLTLTRPAQTPQQMTPNAA